MKKILFAFLLLFASLHAELINEYPSQKILAQHIPVVDIRTPGEWKETGILKGAIPITFFDEKGNYDVRAFLKELNAKVDTKKQFALICRTGSRTSMVSGFLANKLNYNVINLKGGMLYAIGKKLPIVPYNQK
jgi:rhodanese-related sulfurtransferase